MLSQLDSLFVRTLINSSVTGSFNIWAGARNGGTCARLCLVSQERTASARDRSQSAELRRLKFLTAVAWEFHFGDKRELEYPAEERCYSEPDASMLRPLRE